MNREPTLWEIQDLLLRIERDLKDDLKDIRDDIKTKVPRELHDEQIANVKLRLGVLETAKEAADLSLRNVWRTSLGSFATQMVLALVLAVVLTGGSPI